MQFCCGTVLEIPFIPTADVDTLFARAEKLAVRQITDARFGKNAIDAAVLKILSQGERAGELGIVRLTEKELAAHPHPDEVPVLRVGIDLVNFSNEFSAHASQYYGVPEDTPVLEAIIQTICGGELDGYGEAYVSEDTQHPPSRHEEMNRRARIDAAHRIFERMTA